MRLPLLTAVLFTAALYVRADQVTLTSGQRVTGVVEGEQREQVRVRTSTGVVTLPRSSIASIQKQTGNENREIEFDTAAARGDMHAILGMLNGPSAVAGQVALKHVQLHADALVEKTPLQSAADFDAMIRQLGQPEWRTSPQAQLLKARLLARRGKADAAAQVLLEQPASTWITNAQLRRGVASTLLECCDALIDSQNEDLTSQTFALLSLFQQDAPTTQAALLVKLQASNQFAKQGRFASAVNVFDKTEGAAALRVRQQLLGLLVAVEKAGNTTATAETGEAIAARFGEWFQGEDARSLYRATSTSMAKIGRYNDAQSLANMYASLDPDAGAELQHRVEFIRRKQEEASTDTLKQYKLGVWARQMGLLDDSAILFGTLQRDPVIGENALLQLQLLDIDRGKRELERINAMYKAGKYEETVRAIGEFHHQYSDPQLTKRAAELEQLAKYGQWSRAKRLPDMAQAAYQNAERMFNQGRYEESSTEASKVIADYPGSGAAKQAEALLDRANAAVRTRTR